MAEDWLFQKRVRVDEYSKKQDFDRVTVKRCSKSVEGPQLCWNQCSFLPEMTLLHRLACVGREPDNSYPWHPEAANNSHCGGVQHVPLTSAVTGNLPIQFSPLPRPQRETTPIIFQTELRLMFTIISLVTLSS